MGALVLALAFIFVITEITDRCSKEGTYEPKVECDNCGFNGKVEIPKKQSVGWTRCPGCATHHLKFKS